MKIWGNETRETYGHTSAASMVSFFGSGDLWCIPCLAKERHMKHLASLVFSAGHTTSTQYIYIYIYIYVHRPQQRPTLQKGNYDILRPVYSRSNL